MAKQSAQAQKSTTGAWSSSQAYVLALITLIVGIGIGWLVRGSYVSSEAVAANSTSTSSSTAAPAAGGSFQVPSFNQQSPRVALDDVNKAAAPMLAQLQQRPNDPDLMAKLGNLYYDSQAYPQAIEYYQKVLKLRPSDPDVRTDMGTAMYYSGDADGALKEFQTSLSYNPAHNGTLFNRGVVLWQGKGDAKDAIASWQQLLKINPNYPDRPKVEAMIDQAKQHAN
jgi:tetratricopeptide (TPR) repeat protein